MPPSLFPMTTKNVNARKLQNSGGKGQSLQLTVSGKLDSHTQKNEIGPLTDTIHKNQLRMY